MARKPVASYQLLPPPDHYERGSTSMAALDAAWEEAHQLGIPDAGFSITFGDGRTLQQLSWPHETAFLPLYALMGRDCFITWKAATEAYSVYIYTEEAHALLKGFFAETLEPLDFVLVPCKPPIQFREEDQ